MTKYIYKGGIFDYTLSVARACLTHFNKWGVLHAASGSTYWGGLSPDHTELITAAKTLTAEENGKHILYASLTSGVVTLPLASKGKMRFVVSIHALPTSGTGTKVAPQTADKIIGCGLTGTAGQNVGNAVAADALGDFVELISNGVDTWHLVRKTGTWTLALA
jgi:hypothetical protein